VPQDRVLAQRVRSHAAFDRFAARAHRGLLIDNTGGADLAADGPILVAEKPDGPQGWRVHRHDLHPDLTAAL
jgi:hypothetical protein